MKTPPSYPLESSFDLQKKFSYTKGKCNLSFTLCASNTIELLQYHQMLQKAVEDVANTIAAIERMNTALIKL